MRDVGLFIKQYAVNGVRCTLTITNPSPVINTAIITVAWSTAYQAAHTALIDLSGTSAHLPTDAPAPGDFAALVAMIPLQIPSGYSLPYKPTPGGIWTADQAYAMTRAECPAYVLGEHWASFNGGLDYLHPVEITIEYGPAPL